MYFQAALPFHVNCAHRLDKKRLYQLKNISCFISFYYNKRINAPKSKKLNENILTLVGTAWRP